jgi:ubiquinone/menaquinone biosynthesis C-methylase UbiE
MPDPATLVTSAAKPDFGWSWLWLHGHLLLAGLFFLAAAWLALADAALVWVVLTAAGVAWGLVGSVLMRFVFRASDEMMLQAKGFLPGNAGRVLDLGCGSGRTSIMVARARPGAQVTAVDDFSAAYIRSHGPDRFHRNMAIAGVSDRVKLEKGDIRELGYPDCSFDAAVSTYALDHLGPDIPKALSEARRVLRPEGQLLLGVILPNLWVSVTWLFMVWLRFPRRGQWFRLFREAGLDLVEERKDASGAWFLLVRPDGG